jgi:hypothetical protein
MQYLKTRVGQHKTAVNSRNSDYSALAENAVQSGHNTDWVNFNVVTTDTRLRICQILEMINIKNSCLNQQTDSQDLTNV